jgi:CBS domain-containing protein
MKLVGIIKRRSLLLVSSTRSNILVKDVMEEPRIVFGETVSMDEAARLMLKVDEPYAPIVDDRRRLIGIFGYESIVKHLLKIRHRILEEPIEKYMTSKGLIAVNPTTPIYHVWQLMLTHNLPALPVVDDKERIVGVVAEYDLLSRGYARPYLEVDSIRKGPRVQEVMSTPPATLYPTAPLYRAAEIIAKRDIGRVYIVDEDNKLIGVIDRGDIVSAWLGIRYT